MKSFRNDRTTINLVTCWNKKNNLECGILNGAEQDLVKELDKQSKEKMEMEKDFFVEASCLGVLQETKGISLKLSESWL